MSDTKGTQVGAFEVTPEEDRFLRAFFRRQALRYFAVLLAVGVLAVIGRIAFVGESDRGVLPAAARPDPGTVAALESFRAESRVLRKDFDSLRAHLEKRKGASASDLAALNDRIEAALARMQRLEKRAAAAPSQAAPATAAPPDSAASWDVSAILERLYNVEMRLESAPAAPTRTLIERLERLEQRSSGLDAGVGARPDPPEGESLADPSA